MVKAFRDTEEFIPNCNNNHHFRQSLHFIALFVLKMAKLLLTGH